MPLIADEEGHGAVDLFHVLAFDVTMLVRFDEFQLIGLNDKMPVRADKLACIVLHAQIQLLLSVDEDLFVALLVLETDFIPIGADRLWACYRLFSVLLVFSSGRSYGGMVSALYTLPTMIG